MRKLEDDAPAESPKPGIRRLTGAGESGNDSAQSSRAQIVGETAADAVTGGASLASILDPVVAGVGALGSYVVPYTGEGSLKERWENEMQGLRASREEAFKRSPVAATGGALATALAVPLPVPTPLSSAAAAMKAPALLSRAAPVAAKALPYVARIGAGVGDAAIANAATAAASNLDNDPLGHAVDAGTSKWNLLGGVPGAWDAGKAAVGAGMGRLMRPAAKAGEVAAIDGAAGTAAPDAKSTFQEIKDHFVPDYKPSEAALKLQAKGVEGLTVGQMSPASGAATIEELAMHKMGGERLKLAREAPMESLRKVAVKEAFAPGAESTGKGDVLSQMQEAYASYEPAYAKVKEEMIYPAIHGGKGGGVPLQSSANTTGALDMAVMDPSVYAPDTTRQAVQKTVEKYASILPGRDGALGQVDAGQLLAVRSKIRDAARLARKSDDAAAAALFDNAEDAVTASLRSQLGPKAIAHLDATDAKYVNYLALENTVDRAMIGGRSGDFTPRDLLSSALQMKDKRARVLGRESAVDPLIELGQLGHEVMTPHVPMNGLQVAAAAPGFKYFGVPLAHWLNSPGGREYLMNQAASRATEAGQAATPAATRARQLERAAPRKTLSLSRAIRGVTGDSE